MVRELQRSTPHQQIVTQLNAALSVLRSIAGIEMQRLQDTAQRLLDAGRYIPLDAPIMRQATAYQSSVGLPPQDSIIYATIAADLRMRPSPEVKYFLSKNWRDFRAPDILSELRFLGCHYVASFDEALMLIRSQMP